MRERYLAGGLPPARGKPCAILSGVLRRRPTSISQKLPETLSFHTVSFHKSIRRSCNSLVPFPLRRWFTTPRGREPCNHQLVTPPGFLTVRPAFPSRGSGNPIPIPIAIHPSSIPVFCKCAQTPIRSSIFFFAMASWCVFLPRSSSDDVNECLVIFSREFAVSLCKEKVTAKFLDFCREVN